MAKANETQQNTTQTTQQENGDDQQTPRQSPQMSNSQGRSGMARREQFAPALLMTSPFSLIRLLNEELSRLFLEVSSPVGALASRSSDERATAWSPRVDVSERDGQLVMRADLPGMDKGDVEIEPSGRLDSPARRAARRTQ
jgi:HSP20 family protein